MPRCCDGIWLTSSLLEAQVNTRINRFWYAALEVILSHRFTFTLESSKKFTSNNTKLSSSTTNICHLLLFIHSCSLDVKKTSVHRNLKARNTVSNSLPSANLPHSPRWLSHLSPLFFYKQGNQGKHTAARLLLIPLSSFLHVLKIQAVTKEKGVKAAVIGTWHRVHTEQVYHRAAL